MRADLKHFPHSCVELTIELSPQDMSGYLNSASQQLSRDYKIPGFRPGLAPVDVIKQQLGQEKLNQTAVEIAVKESFYKALQENNLEIIDDPKITVPTSSSRAEQDGLTFKAVVAVMPAIDLPDYKNIKIPLAPALVEDKEIDRVLEEIKKSKAQNTAVTRPAQKGDRVEIDFTAKINGEIIEDGQSKQHPLILGENHFMPGFENELIGLKEHETKSFSLKAPAEYHRRELAGKMMDFEVKINLVEERKLPELTDAFARSLGKFNSLEELKQNIKEGLLDEKEIKAKEERRAKIASSLIKNISAELPEELIASELDKMTVEFREALGRMNMDQESYLSHIKKTVEDLKKEWRPKAEDRIKIALILKEIAQKENLEPSEEEIESKLSQLLRTAPPMRPGQNLDLTALRGYVKGMIRNEKVFELLESSDTNTRMHPNDANKNS